MRSRADALILDAPKKKRSTEPAVKYGLIAGSKSVNAAIYRCFEFISEADARSFVKKFAAQRHDNDQVMCAFRELILGAFLGSCGLTVESERPIEGKTPDWTVLQGGEPACLIELVNFHRAQAFHPDRLYQVIHKKCAVYAPVVAASGLPYIVGLYGHFLADLSREEVEGCLHDPDTGLFKDYPPVSGLIFFDDNFARYRFVYFSNHLALRPFALPEGEIDLSYWTR
jgi:hypothetical protein